MKILLVADKNSLKYIPGTKETFISSCLKPFIKQYGDENIIIQVTPDSYKKLKQTQRMGCPILYILFFKFFLIMITNIFMK